MPVILGGSVGRGFENGGESISSSCPLVTVAGVSSVGLGVTLAAWDAGASLLGLGQETRRDFLPLTSRNGLLYGRI